MLGRLGAEASRRRVFRGAAIYIIIAWLAVQLIDANAEPGDPLRRLAITWAIGLFPLAVVFSWVFQVRPGHVDREHHDAAAPPVTPLGRALDIVAATGILVIAAVEILRLVMRPM
jgi:hypothetical protein